MRAFFFIFLITATACAYKKQNAVNKTSMVIPGGIGKNWKQVVASSSFSHILLEIDDQSINRRNGDLVYFQERFSFKKLQNKVKFVINHAVLDCKKNKYAVISTSTYDRIGSLIKHFDTATPSLTPIVSGSLNMAKYQYLCEF